MGRPGIRTIRQCLVVQGGPDGVGGRIRVVIGKKRPDPGTARYVQPTAPAGVVAARTGSEGRGIAARDHGSKGRVRNRAELCSVDEDHRKGNVQEVGIEAGLGKAAGSGRSGRRKGRSIRGGEGDAAHLERAGRVEDGTAKGGIEHPPGAVEGSQGSDAGSAHGREIQAGRNGGRHPRGLKGGVVRPRRTGGEADLDGAQGEQGTPAGAAPAELAVGRRSVTAKGKREDVGNDVVRGEATGSLRDGSDLHMPKEVDVAPGVGHGVASLVDIGSDMGRNVVDIGRKPRGSRWLQRGGSETLSPDLEVPCNMQVPVDGGRPGTPGGRTLQVRTTVGTGTALEGRASDVGNIQEAVASGVKHRLQPRRIPCTGGTAGYGIPHRRVRQDVGEVREAGRLTMVDAAREGERVKPRKGRSGGGLAEGHPRMGAPQDGYLQ